MFAPRDAPPRGAILVLVLRDGQLDGNVKETHISVFAAACGGMEDDSVVSLGDFKVEVDADVGIFTTVGCTLLKDNLILRRSSLA